MEEKKSYSVKELASILGCSVTAVQKKITPSENNPEIKRYKKRFNVVIKDGKTVILLSDAELEEEKRLSKGFNNVNTPNNETFENVIDVEPEPQKQVNQDVIIDKILDFTNVHIQRYETLQKTYYNELQQKDKQILLLTTSENTKQAEYIETQAKAKELEKRNRLLTLYLTFVTTLLLTFIILFITFYITVNNLPNTEPKKPSIEDVSTVENVNNGN
jgi:hypothetical protein